MLSVSPKLMLKSGFASPMRVMFEVSRHVPLGPGVLQYTYLIARSLGVPYTLLRTTYPSSLTMTESRLHAWPAPDCAALAGSAYSSSMFRTQWFQIGRASCRERGEIS